MHFYSLSMIPSTTGLTLVGGESGEHLVKMREQGSGKRGSGKWGVKWPRRSETLKTLATADFFPGITPVVILFLICFKERAQN